MREQAITVVTTLNQAGVEPLVMKGALLLLTDLLPDLGMRVAADLDLVIADEQWAPRAPRWKGAGYARTRNHRSSIRTSCHSSHADAPAPVNSTDRSAEEHRCRARRRRRVG